MEIELRIYDVDPDYRWNWLQLFERELMPLHARLGGGRDLGRYVSYRDDATFVWMQGFANRDERLAARERLSSSAEWSARLAQAPSAPRRSIVRNLTPVDGSTIAALDDFARMDATPMLELRQYRIRPGRRAEFAAFFRDRTLAAQAEHGMAVFGPFDDLDDDNILTWFRGFPDLIERDRRKASFYQSPYWLNELQDDAFSMIEDYSNVILVARA